MYLFIYPWDRYVLKAVPARYLWFRERDKEREKEKERERELV